MRSAMKMTLAAGAIGLMALMPQAAGAQTTVSTTVYRPAENGVSVTQVRGYRYGYRPYAGRYYAGRYAVARPYGYGAYARPYGYGYGYGVNRPYYRPYNVYRPYYGNRAFGPAPYYGGFYGYGRPAFSFGFGW